MTKGTLRDERHTNGDLSSEVVLEVFRLTVITPQLLVSFLIAAGTVAVCRNATGVPPGNHVRDARATFKPHRYLAAPVLAISSFRGWRTTSGQTTGENIFRAKCAVCHGVDGAGRTPNGKKLKVPDLRSDRVQNHADDELLDIVMNGKGDMPPFGKKYSPGKLQKVVSYVRSLGRRN